MSRLQDNVILQSTDLVFSFYRDGNGEPTLKNHGFMIEWAKRAGELVFQDAQNLHRDNIVTFSILALFWYTQGSWRLCYLFKGMANVPRGVARNSIADWASGNASLLLHVGGFGPTYLLTENSLESEIQRRRLWASYLSHCQLGENLLLFEPIANVRALSLPWPKADFEDGISRSPSISLESGGSNGEFYAEFIKGMTVW